MVFIIDSNYPEDHYSERADGIVAQHILKALGIGDAFAAADRRPKIILGSSDDRRPADYVAAWALLYRAFRAQGIRRRVAQEALAGICATVHHNFRYLRWDDDRERYRQYPGAGKLFEVTERT